MRNRKMLIKKFRRLTKYYTSSHKTLKSVSEGHILKPMRLYAMSIFSCDLGMKCKLEVNFNAKFNVHYTS